MSQTHVAENAGPDGKASAPQGGSGQSGQGHDADTAALLKGLPHACFVVDREWRLTYVNPEAEQLLKQLAHDNRASLLGKDIRLECPEIADSTFSKECHDALAEQRAIEVETFYPALNRWFAVRVSPAGNRLAVFLRDITQRTALERALMRRNEELKEADRGKDAFLVELAHEVRNALVSVRNALHVLGGRDQGEAGRQACALADHEVRRLSRLMDDLTKLSQLNPHLPDKQRLNVAAIIGQTLTEALTSDRGGGRNLTLRLPPEPLWVEAHPGQLEQVLGHLLDNAVKFTGPDGTIRVSAEREGDQIVLRVRDDGVGLADDIVPHVFNLFMRQPTTSGGRFHGGLGVGLTLVRHLVQLHGGAVEARSEGVGRGSEFVVRLPALKEGETQLEVAAPEPEVEHNLDILVVDDSVDAAQSLALVLRGWGYNPRVVYDGIAALEAVDLSAPDLVLMDIGMPGMDGYQVATHLRRDHSSDELTLVALTGYGQDEDRNRALEVGFDYHMVKPVDPNDLKDLLAYIEAGTQAAEEA
jgi:signal transduction histidine kinase/ActR/RegA family two-component response regulator